MNSKLSEIDALIAQIEGAVREELLSVFKGETPPRDDFEKHLVEVTKIRNKLAENSCEKPSSAIEEALQHLEEARKQMPNSNQRDILSDILNALETEFNQMKKQVAYNDIMSALLQAYEAHPEMDVEEIIAQVAQEMGTSEKSMESIKATSELLDRFQEKKTALEAAHEDGESTKKWILTETAHMTESRTDDEKAAVANAIAEAIDGGVKNSLAEEQNKQEE